MSSSGDALQQKLQALEKYTACDISDALLKLYPTETHAGFLADVQFTHSYYYKTLIAPASTLLFTAKSSSTDTPEPSAHPFPPRNIPTGPGMHYADLVPCRGKILVISQPPGQTNAVVGGLVAARLLARGGKGVVVDGRVRDLSALYSLPSLFPVWARGTSTVGAGAAAVAHAHSVPLTISGVTVHPGDIIFAELSARGVVCIPRDILDEVLEVLPGLVAADKRVMEAVREGVEMGEAIMQYRS